MTRLALIVLTLVFSSGCIVAGGYSSDGGWFIWPGSILGIVAIVLVLLFFLRRR